MKRILLTLTFVAVVSLASQAQTRLGAGFGWGSEIEELGIGINGEFFVKDNISINPGFIFFLVDDGPFDKQNFWTFNANGNFYFHDSESVSVYGIGGLNLSTYSYEFGDNEDSNTELGINLGIGSNFDVGGSVMPYAELKYVLGDFDQLVLFFGAKFNLN
jgi:outer membrane protein X